MDEIEYNLQNYKDVTIEIINTIKRGDFENIMPLFSKREENIVSIQNMRYSVEELTKIFKEKNIIKLDEELRDTINLKKKYIMEQINSASNLNNAVINYNKCEKKNLFNIFNEKI